MIKIQDNICTINGSKDEVITELYLAACFILKKLNTIETLILLHTLTDTINKSLKEKIDE